MQVPLSVQYHVCEELVWRVLCLNLFSFGLNGPCSFPLHRLSSSVDFGGMHSALINLQTNQLTHPGAVTLLGPILHLAHCSTELTVSLSVPPSSVVSLPAFCY